MVSLECTENQLGIIMAALEDYFRLRMGQTYIGLLDDLAFQNIQVRKDGKIDDDVFNECIWRRDDAREKLSEMFDILFNRDLSRMKQTEEVKTAVDIWHVIRHWFWKQRPPESRGIGTDSYDVMQIGKEPLPEIWSLES